MRTYIGYATIIITLVSRTYMYSAAKNMFSTFDVRYNTVNNTI